MKKVSYFLIILFSTLLVASCYKLVSTYAPSEVEPGQTFEVSFTVIDDGSDRQDFVTDWSFAGIRVPKGWTVTVPEGAHRQFAEDWVYYPDGSQVNSSHDMEPCDKLTQFYNAVCKKTGYTWAGFKSVQKIPKNISACWRNGCDSIRISAGIDKYTSYTAAKDSRLFHVGTAAGSYVSNRNAALARTVIVTDPTAINDTKDLKDPKDPKDLKDLSGRPATKQTRIIINNGKKILQR